MQIYRTTANSHLLSVDSLGNCLFLLHVGSEWKMRATLATENEEIVEREELPFFHVDLLMCHKFMWLKWKRELGSVYSTIKLSFKPKDFTTLKL